MVVQIVFFLGSAQLNFSSYQMIILKAHWAPIGSTAFCF